mmetsp:Transcript_26136/g.60952  ORF Transcript_26136/g.60952 Transcript_26136/m.60952 type:complete len:224 (+) Transcript_26136:310-981(+)
MTAPSAATGLNSFSSFLLAAVLLMFPSCAWAKETSRFSGKTLKLLRSSGSSLSRTIHTSLSTSHLTTCTGFPFNSGLESKPLRIALLPGRICGARPLEVARRQVKLLHARQGLLPPCCLTLERSFGSDVKVSSSASLWTAPLHEDTAANIVAINTTRALCRRTNETFLLPPRRTWGSDLVLMWELPSLLICVEPHGSAILLPVAAISILNLCELLSTVCVQMT